MAANTRMIQCIRCKHGKYMQWMKNPIICECNFTQERYVAEARRLCSMFEEAGNREIEITHFSHY